MSMELADSHAAEGAPGPSLRDHVESAFAAHTSGPDVSSAVNCAVEQRDTELRQRDRQARPGARDWQAEVAEKRRQHVRDAVTQARLKTSDQASAPRQVEPGAVPSPGAPASWDTTAKAHWESIPQEVRLAIQRDHAGFASNPVYHEIEAVLAPARAEYSKHGLSDSQAIGRLMEWESAVRNPQTRIQAAHALMQQYGITLADLGGGPQHYQPQMPQSDPAAVARESQRLGKFAQGRSNFEQVRESMGLILSRYPERYLQADGNVNLDALYTAACKAEGVSGRPASTDLVPPRPRAPAAQGTSVRQSLRAAMRG